MNPKSELDRAEILDWRNSERLELVSAIKERIPSITQKTDALIDDMSAWDSIWRSSFHDREIAPVVESWLVEVMTELKHEIEESAQISERSLGNDATDHSWTWGEIAGAGAATAATLAPLAVLPFVASIATVSTTSFLVFSTSVVSLPILAVVVGGATIAGVGGEKTRRYVSSWITDGYREQVRAEIYNKAVGDPVDLEAPALCRRLLADIDLIANTRLEHLE